MVDWSTMAFVFPGQASQVVGMGQALADTYPAAREVFEQADELLGFPISVICFEGPEAALNDTINTQPALFVTSIATLRALASELPDVRPAFAAGHSFGEFTALTAVGALSFADGLRLVRERGRLMKAAGENSPGAMAAILGLEIDAVRELCDRASAESGGVLVVANDNCPGQVVISGEVAAIDHAITLAKTVGAKRALKLAVSIAAHSPLMQHAAESFKAAVEQAAFTAPAAPVYANVSAQPLTDAGSIRAELVAQLVSPVRWRESVEAMIAAGAQTFVEVGPKDVLTGLLKRIDSTRPAYALNSLEALQQFTAL